MNNSPHTQPQAQITAPTNHLPFATPYVAGREQADVTVDRAEMLRYLGYGGQSINPELADRIEHVAQAVETKLKPTFVWRVFKVDAKKTQSLSRTFPKSPNTHHANGEGEGEGEGRPCIYLEGVDLALPGTSIARHMDGALAIAAVCTTLGFASERLLQEAAVAGAADALLYSAAASSLTEQGAAYAQTRIDAFAAANGMFANMRYSPGYGDLPLDVQPALARALNLQKTLGVSLTADDMLVPIKSTTALIGLFDHKVSREYANTCADCPAGGKCNFRQIGHFCYE
jgi:hypothetical protein